LLTIRVQNGEAISQGGLMGTHFDKLTPLQQSAVDWHVEKLVTKQIDSGGGPAIYATNNTSGFTERLRESVASGGGVEQVVSTYKRHLEEAAKIGLKATGPAPNR
jgi:hypothetical protein